jgi:predicted nucleic acid-binding protein
VDRLVLSDAAPLICLAQVGGLPWLSTLFGRVHITEAVRDEILTGLGKLGEDAIAQATKRRLLRVHPEWDSPEPPFPGLGQGEASCIRACANLLKRKRDCLLLVDDREARRVASALMIPVTGTAAVIGAAKQAGLIASGRAVFEQLLHSGFRISPAIVDAILESVGEADGEQKHGHSELPAKKRRHKRRAKDSH